MDSPIRRARGLIAIALLGCASSSPSEIDASVLPTEQRSGDGRLPSEDTAREATGACDRQEVVVSDAGARVVVTLPCRPFDPKLDVPDPQPRD